MIPASPLRAIIVDDEPVARELLAAMLVEEQAAVAVEVVADCANAREAVEAIHEHRPDVVFLDVQMPDGDGFSVIETVGAEEMPAIVFVTAYDQYALRAFDVVAVDYLLKPFNEDRLERTLRRLERQVRHPDGAAGERLATLIEELRGRPRYATRLAVDAGRHMAFVSTEEVDWIEAKGRHSIVHAGAESYLTREGLTSITGRLDPEAFIRIHRSSVVRIDRIREVHRWFRGGYYLVLKDGTKLTTGGTYKRLVEGVLLGAQRPPA